MLDMMRLSRLLRLARLVEQLYDYQCDGAYSKKEMLAAIDEAQASRLIDREEALDLFLAYIG